MGVAAALWLLALGWAAAAAIQGALWLVARRTRNAGIVDVGWALSFTPIAWLFAWRGAAPWCGWLPLALVVTAWSLRLGGYLIARGAASGPEEGRYAELRRRWSAGPDGQHGQDGPAGGTDELAAARRADRAFFVFFQAQAALAAVLAAAFVVPFVVAPSGPAWLRVAGALVSGAGVVGEAVADAQLAAWRRDPARRGQVCDRGLWGWSRHPNYFFEWLVWIGHVVYGLAFWPSGLVALGPQALILASIWGVTGIPPTEAQALRTRGDAYRAYQARVSAFVPWPPRRPRA